MMAEATEANTENLWERTEPKLNTFTEFSSEAEGYLAAAETAKNAAQGWIEYSGTFGDDATALQGMISVVADELVACNTAKDSLEQTNDMTQNFWTSLGPDFEDISSNVAEIATGLDAAQGFITEATGYRENENQEASYTRSQDALSRTGSSLTSLENIENEANELYISLESIIASVQQSYTSAQGFCDLIMTSQADLDAMIAAAEQAAEDAENEEEDAPAVCQDTNFDENGVMTTDRYRDGCSAYDNHPNWCGIYFFNDDDFDMDEMCCSCGGGSTSGAPEIPAEVEEGACVNTNFDAAGNEYTDNWGDGCNEYEGKAWWCGVFNTATFKSDEQCCFCGGGSTSG
jgi:hypothetical protein